MTGLSPVRLVPCLAHVKRAEQRPGLRSALHIIIPKGKELTTNVPIVPRSSSILIISSRAGPFLPGPFPPCRPGQTRTLCGGKKLRTIFLRHLLRHFLRHLLRHEHVGTMQLKPASEKQSTPSGPPTIRSY